MLELGCRSKLALNRRQRTLKMKMKQKKDTRRDSKNEYPSGSRESLQNFGKELSKNFINLRPRKFINICNKKSHVHGSSQNRKLLGVLKTSYRGLRGKRERNISDINSEDLHVNEEKTNGEHSKLHQPPCELNLHDIEKKLEEVDLYNIPDNDIQRLSKLKIVLPFKIPDSHLIETRLSHALNKRQLQAFAKSGIKIKKGRFKPWEDEVIRNNWKKFSDEFEFDDPGLFILMSYNGKTFIKYSERLKFVQYIANELPNRFLHSVYRRFKTLFARRTTSDRYARYDAVVDASILMIISKGWKDPFAKLAAVTGRDRHSLFYRYHNHLINKDQELESSLVLKDVTLEVHETHKESQKRKKEKVLGNDEIPVDESSQSQESPEVLEASEEPELGVRVTRKKSQMRKRDEVLRNAVLVDVSSQSEESRVVLEAANDSEFEMCNTLSNDEIPVDESSQSQQSLPEASSDEPELGMHDTHKKSLKRKTAKVFCCEISVNESPRCEESSLVLEASDEPELGVRVTRKKSQKRKRDEVLHNAVLVDIRSQSEESRVVLEAAIESELEMCNTLSNDEIPVDESSQSQQSLPEASDEPELGVHDTHKKSLKRKTAKVLCCEISVNESPQCEESSLVLEASDESALGMHGAQKKSKKRKRDKVFGNTISVDVSSQCEESPIVLEVSELVCDIKCEGMEDEGLGDEDKSAEVQEVVETCGDDQTEAVCINDSAQIQTSLLLEGIEEPPGDMNNREDNDHEAVGMHFMVRGGVENSVSDRTEQSDFLSFLELKLTSEAVRERRPITNDDIQRLLNLEIELPLSISASHLIEKKLRNGINEKQLQKFAVCGVKMKGKYNQYTPKEDAVIHKNWNKFSKEYGFDDPEQFLKMYYHGKLCLTYHERLKFILYIANGLPNRYLCSVYRRFQYLYLNYNTSQFGNKKLQCNTEKEIKNVHQNQSIGDIKN